MACLLIVEDDGGRVCRGLGGLYPGRAADAGWGRV